MSLKASHSVACALGLAFALIAIGCEGPGAEEVASTESGLLLYPDTFVYQQGPLNCDDGVKRDLRIGSRRHIHSYFGTAGQRVRFRLSMHQPESEGRGAAMWVFDDSGALVNYKLDWYAEEIDVDLLVPRDGEYLVYVSHADFWGFEYDTAYPYQLMAFCDTGLCARVTLDLPGEQYGLGYFAKNFPWYEEAAASSWYPDAGPDADLPVVSRDVVQQQCRAIVDMSCTPDDPPVCCAGIDFFGTAPNACACRNYIHGRAGTDGYGLGSFRTGSCEL